MEKVYFTDCKIKQDAIRTAIKKAFSLVSEDENLKTIVLLFSNLSVADSVLSDVIPSLTRGNRSIHCDDPSCGVLVETIKNYSFRTCHILMPVYVSEKELIQYEDEWYAKNWIIVPNDISAMDNWLRTHTAENVITGQTIALNSTLDDRVVNGIEWLWATSYPNEGFLHPLDSNRLKSMANGLAANNVPLDYYTVLHYCINHKINHDGGRKIADHFVKAQTRKFKTDGNYPLSFMTEMMNTKHKRI